MSWFAAHWVEVLGVVGGLHAVAKVIVNLTPTETDNKILASIEKLVRFVGLQPKGK